MSTKETVFEVVAATARTLIPEIQNSFCPAAPATGCKDKERRQKAKAS